MTPIDFFIVLGYFGVMFGAGVYFRRTSSTSVKSYFLGDNQAKWWMLAASGASTNFSIGGTVWNLAILMVLGMKSFWVTLVWWMPNAIFLMVYSGIWIRRCGVTTSAELNKVRFGVGRGAQWARTSFAVMITLFSVASLCMSYIIIQKFATVFYADTQSSAHLVAAIVVGLTGVYVLFGGFKGVILTDFLQTALLFAIAFIVGWICLQNYSASELHAAIAGGSGTEAISVAYWKSLAPEAQPKLGIFADSSYAGWKDFVGVTLAFSIVGMIGCVGGAGGRYGEQRFLATKNSKEAAKMAALWQFFGFPRWIMTAGLAFLAFALYRDVVAGDPEQAMPLFLKSGLMAPGVMGLVVAGLTAAYMSTFSSEINACTSIIIKDIYQPLFRPSIDENSPSLVRSSYFVTGFLTLASIAIGYYFVESQAANGGSALNTIWSWMLGGLLTCIVIPLAFRWYWGRMNGWGFALGCIVPLVPSLTMLASKFVDSDHLLKQIPDNTYTYVTLAISFVACILGSLLTRPLDNETTLSFYCKIRPFGFWGKAEQIAQAEGRPMATKIPGILIIVNVILGLVASFALFMAPVYFFGHWAKEGWVCTSVFLVSCFALYFTWYRTLPDD